MGRNNRNGRFGLNLGLFLFASRTGRRTIEALGRMGLSASYLTIHRAVKALSRSARRQLIAKIKDPFSVLALGYDNINWLQRARNKGLTVTNTMRAAVHGVVYEVDASVQLQEGPQHPVCDPLVVDEIFGSDMPKPSTTPTNLADRAHNPDGLWPKIREQRDQMRKQATPDIHPFSLLSSETDDEQFVLSVVSHARKAFLTQHQYLDYDHPFPEPPQIWPLTPRKTVVHTLPVLDVDEGSVEGNIEVFKQYLDKHVKVPNSFWRDRVLSIIADAFTTEKIKQAQRTRNLDRSPDSFDKFDAQQPWAAPWHLMYAYIRCLFLNHGGAKDQPSAISFRHLSERVGFRNLLTQPYNFHDSSRFLHFWFAAACNSVIEEAVRKHLDPLSTASSADKPADNPAHAAQPARGTAERRARHPGGENDAEHPAEEFKGRLDHETFLRISNAAIRDLLKYSAQDLLDEQEEDGKKRDDIALHSRTMFADVALFIELQAAIKVGGAGRLILAMKMLVPRFQSTGQHNYVSELLEIIVSLRFEMPPALRAIMVASLFVNTDGGRNTFVPTDLLQENFVFDLKHTWPVGGTTKSLEYKQVIGSLLQVLAGMKMGLWEDLGIASQSQNHSDKKRAITITALQRDFDRLKIFEWDDQGRAGSEFEVMRGDAVRQERSSLQAAGKSTKHIRQSKTMACDAWASGMLQLSGTSTGSGSYDRWKARQALSLGKEGAAATHADADQPVLEGAAAEEGFAYIGLSSSTAGFEELEDDVC
ncbi:unnamed protein product [Tilletia laevis]|uniref:DUF6589 domain-containing protein n=3 Tax=Tilletia TaxID=13289 RepID=A0A9N8M2B2_9BASI|nr:unnamed protein product [Tilletia caries]CAD6933234.1 unnamed protein product [Tilletia caries]CAD6955545.1 unnamed protein product [Tilletia laevis]